MSRLLGLVWAFIVTVLTPETLWKQESPLPGQLWESSVMIWDPSLGYREKGKESSQNPQNESRAQGGIYGNEPGIQVILYRGEVKGTPAEPEIQVILNEETALGEVKKAPLPYSMDEIQSYSFLMSHIYAADEMAGVSAEVINGEAMLQPDFTMEIRKEPQILIYHTHSQEEYADSRPGIAEDTVVGTGDYLAEVLTKKYGLSVIHDRTTYDMQSGELDRHEAYTYARAGVKRILEQYPDIQVMIDIHRDSVGENRHLITELEDGRTAAQVMLFNGLSADKNGPIEYLYNPNRAANLAFSFQMRMQADALYPGLIRSNYLHCYCYNMDLRERSLLLEVGAENTTIQEAKNAMDPIADVLYHVLQGI